MLLQNVLHITLSLLCNLQHICIYDPLDSMSYARYGILFSHQIPTIKLIYQYATFTFTLPALSKDELNWIVSCKHTVGVNNFGRCLKNP